MKVHLALSLSAAACGGKALDRGAGPDGGSARDAFAPADLAAPFAPSDLAVAPDLMLLDLAPPADLLIAIGTKNNPGQSCKDILRKVPMAPSGLYFIRPLNLTFQTFCDMDVQGGGWTRIAYPAVDDTTVAALVSNAGRQMLKCSEAGAAHIISPVFSSWTWTPSGFVQLPGTWVTNGANSMCGADPEYTDKICNTWFGVGCGNGGGNTNKLFPGVSDQTGCADRMTAHTNLDFSVCGGAGGPSNYNGWVVFLRSEN